jgi:dienelactone hydrolase
VDADSLIRLPAGSIERRPVERVFEFYLFGQFRFTPGEQARVHTILAVRPVRVDVFERGVRPGACARRGHLGGGNPLAVWGVAPVTVSGNGLGGGQRGLPAHGAPAAVEDSRCALRWVIRNAAKYHFDVNKLVVTGESAGSHLALTTGMLPASAGFDGQCPGPEDLRVAAIVNWYGVTDVLDVLEGANQQPYAVRWLGSVPNNREVARRVSPLQHVRAGLPAILTIHGDADLVAPYSHAVRLHEALDEAKVPNQLLTLRGGDHGTFTRDQRVSSYVAVRAFLKQHGLVK